jgi:hypothetical protein
MPYSISARSVTGSDHGFIDTVIHSKRHILDLIARLLSKSQNFRVSGKAPSLVSL